MKFAGLLSPRSGICCALAFVAGWLMAQSDDIPLNVGVRSTVDRPLTPLGKRTADPAPDHGKVYLIAFVKLLPGAEKLVKPVDEASMVKQLQAELDRHGFHQVKHGQKPDIVLGLFYGRGMLNNPYLAGTAATQDNLQGPAYVQADQGGIAQLMKQKGTGYEEKIQRAKYEKLVVHVLAMNYPKHQGDKPKEVWMTTMNVDDPDHRDLNLYYKEMLAAGSPYFDKEITDPEVNIIGPPPEGHVNVGETKVVEGKKEENGKR